MKEDHDDMKIEIVTVRLDVGGGATTVQDRSQGPVENVHPMLFEWDGAPHVALVMTTRLVLPEKKLLEPPTPRNSAEWRASLRPTERDLYDQLAAWRRERAAEDDLPAFQVFNNRTLATIAAVRPLDDDELAGVFGVGPLKLQRYGAEVLAVVKAHVTG